MEVLTNLQINNEKKELIEQITMGKKLVFNYINGEKFIKFVNDENIFNEITFIDIMKYNFSQIILQLEKYFSNVKIVMLNNSQCITESEIKQNNYTYKYDLYLILNKNDKIYEYGFDFYSSQSEIPENKFTHSKTLLDDYVYYLEEDIKTNQDMEYYLNEILFKLLTSICALIDDEYLLAEILYVKTNKKDKTKKEIIKDLSYFLKIINWKKDDKIDLDDLYDDLEIIDNNLEKQINFVDFTNLIKKVCDNFELKFNKKEKTICFDIFESFILSSSNTNYSSRKIMYYLKIYMQAMKLLMESLKIIISLIKEINIKKKYTADYINNLIMYHLDEYIDQSAINKIYINKVLKFKNSFDDILEDFDNLKNLDYDSDNSDNSNNSNNSNNSDNSDNSNDLKNSGQIMLENKNFLKLKNKMGYLYSKIYDF